MILVKGPITVRVIARKARRVMIIWRGGSCDLVVPSCVIQSREGHLFRDWGITVVNLKSNKTIIRLISISRRKLVQCLTMWKTVSVLWKNRN